MAFAMPLLACLVTDAYFFSLILLLDHINIYRHDVDEFFFPGALDLLQFLKGRGVRLCAVTNGNCDIDRIAAFEGTYCCCFCVERACPFLPLFSSVLVAP